MRSLLRSPYFALALLGAIVTLLAAWVLPLPRLVLSEEEAAAGRMPQTRTDVDAARKAFLESQDNYKGYVATHDVGAALGALESAGGALKAAPSDPATRGRVGAAMATVSEYVGELSAYFAAGEQYFKQLGHYDDELMAWTRSLGTSSETLRPDTWPIVEYLKLYPPPVGLSPDYKSFDEARLTALAGVLQISQDDINPEAIAAAVSEVREAGRSVEFIESLHPGYHTLLENYYGRVQAVAAGGTGREVSGARALLAAGTNVVLAVMLVVGMALLFMGRTRIEHEPAR